MKALTIAQPSATLVALGVITVELYPWLTSYRGLLAIHAAEVYPQMAKDRVKLEPFKTLLRKAGFYHWVDLPTGAIIAVCQLDDCRLIVEPSEEGELAWNAYTPGHYAWRFSNVHLLSEPVRARDGWGLWDWDAPAMLADTLGTGVCAAPRQRGIRRELRFDNALLSVLPVD